MSGAAGFVLKEEHPMALLLNLPLCKSIRLSIGWFELALGINFIMLSMGMESGYGIRFLAGAIGITSIFCLLGGYPRIRMIVGSASGALIICDTFILACLSSRFTPDLHSFIWHDDAPMLYSFTMQGVEMLRQGGVFGWNSSLLGGYPAFLDTQYNLAFFSAPFMFLFGDVAGFNLTVFLSILIFPILAYCGIRAWFPAQRIAEVWGMYLSTILLRGYFGDFLGNCSFNSMVGLDCYLLVIIFVKKFVENKYLSAFSLAVVTSCACYAHLSYFALSLMTIVLVILFSRERKRNALRAVVACGVVVCCTLPYIWPFINYRGYFIEDVQHFTPKPMRLVISCIVPCALQQLRDVLSEMLFLPLILWSMFCSNRNGLRTLAWACGVLTVLICLGMCVTDQAFSRMLRGLPLLSMVLVAALGALKGDFKRPSGGFTRFFLLFVLVTSLLIYGSPMFLGWTTPRLKSLSSLYGSFLDRIRAMDGNLVLFEGAGGLNHATESASGKRSEKWSDDVHLVGVFALETGKDLFASNIDGFPPSIFRSNSISCGTWKGRFLSEYSPETVNAMLQHWGVKYLVLWSNEARHYFSQQHSVFRCVWKIDAVTLQRAGFEPVGWEIYEFLHADPRSVAVSPGSGEVEGRGYFGKTLRLRGVRKGSAVVVRMNYFPAWSASCEGRPLELFDRNGQLAFKAPADGDMAVALAYPRHGLLTGLALLSLTACGFLSWRRRL